MVLVYLAYVLIAFRERDPAAQADGPPIRGHMRTQTWWVASTTLVVLGLAAFGTYELLAARAAGRARTRRSCPPRRQRDRCKEQPLQVQVIGQQWQFTFR